ncbi:MAG: PHP domain-containing protein [Desulfobacula sp.]|nr:PHP domain-containing protein [Desulfobacula sp.]
MKNKIFADLHNHTTASDGDFTPAKMVEQAKIKGIKAIGITDHDTLHGLIEAIKAGRKYNITIIPGVEVSIRFKRSYFTGTLHLLCYFTKNMLLDNKFVTEFKNILAKGRGEKLVIARVNEINKFFGPQSFKAGPKKPLLKNNLEFKDIAALSDNATRRHFALALKEVFNITNPDTINTIIGNNSEAYLPSGIQLKKITGFIRKNKILAVLAHPAAGSFPGQGHYKEVLPPFEIVEKIFPEFLEAGIQGLEVYYPGHTNEDQNKLKSLALKHKLIITGGSDCHDSKERPFGVQGVSQSEFKLFKESLPWEKTQ